MIRLDRLDVVEADLHDVDAVGRRRHRERLLDEVGHIDRLVQRVARTGELEQALDDHDGHADLAVGPVEMPAEPGLLVV